MSALNWRKSSYSGTAANCLNVRTADGGTVKLRESDYPTVVITTTPDALRSFVCAAKAGEFDGVTDHGPTGRGS
ncbi:DUF397 domain-containing protein [Streptomyces sp. B1866]|uniref:DUF397 domain-containing protein n=1 Tax=Streptomyces sp. B1866 TaxID=3075431 RepID=UPI00289246E9|nr:DUF397 domain-containing protein [Streptomyces sp. B1866]MDT3395552.1 DUF397 domain-containing protein [Streptomyces sp. B1866]